MTLTDDMKGPLPSGSKGNSAAKRIAVLKRLLYIRNRQAEGWSYGRIARSLGVTQQSLSGFVKLHSQQQEAQG